MKLLPMITLMCVLCGCRTGKADPFQLAGERVEQAVSRSFTQSSDAGPAQLKVRYNPAQCTCPPYEVFAYGRWMRAFIEGDSPAVAALQNADELAIATIVAAIDEPRAAENGVQYPVVSPR